MPNSQHDAFTRIENAALRTNQSPTEAQKLSGDYQKGVVNIHGLLISIENARGTVRSGTGDGGKQWRNLMPDHYGEIRGTVGADGDAVDIWIGPWPESKRVFVVNQLFVSGSKKGQFDEHKFMVCYPSQEMARNAYRNAYDRDFQGFGGLVEMTFDQFFWWLRYGAKDKPISLDVLPPAGLELAMSPSLDSIIPYTRWADAAPVTQSIDALVYQIRRSDASEGLMLDSATMAELIDGHESASLDALVVPVNVMSLKMEAMRKVMDMAGNSVKTVSVQISDPVKKAGSTNVAVLFELSDGQTVTIWFHNPDTTPSKLSPTDDLISWKWLLNKKDVTIVVAPERGQDLNVREVSRRIMRLAEKNSAAFQKANVNRAAKLAEIETLKGEISVAEKTLAELQDRVAAKALEPAAKPEKVSTYEQGRINSKTGRWNRDGYLYAYSTAEYQAYRWVSETSVQREFTGTANGAMTWLGEVLAGMGDTKSLDALQVLSRLKFVSGDDLLAAVATPAAAPAKLSLVEWEGEVIRIMEEDGEGMTNSDAQGVYMVQESKAEDAYRQGKTPAEGAEIVLNASLAPAPAVVAEPAPTPVQKKPVTPQLSGNPEKFIKIAADSVKTLRSVDVERVLRETPAPFRGEVAMYVRDNRKDLVDEVNEVLAELAAPAASPAPSVEVENPTQYQDWEAKLLSILEGLGVTTSDAQALMETGDDDVGNAFNEGMTPAQVAKLLMEKDMTALTGATAEAAKAAADTAKEAAKKTLAAAADLAEQAKQAEYTPFDASQVKLPTAVQLGSNKPNTFTVFEGNDSAWSNGAILDLSRPSFIQKAMNEFIGGGEEPNGQSAKTLRKFPSSAIEKLMGNAKGSTILVEPIAFNDGHDLEKTGKKNGWVEETKQIPRKSVILADESRSFSVAVDLRYFGYFYRSHKGCEFFASEDGGSILVKKASQVIGLIMPRKLGHTSAQMLKYATNASEAKKQDAPEPMDAETQAEVDKVNAAYQFDNATDDFKAGLADSVEKEDYSPFLSAKTIDQAAKALGMSIRWATRAASFDSSTQDPVSLDGCDPKKLDECSDDEEGYECDPEKEFADMPEMAD